MSWLRSQHREDYCFCTLAIGKRYRLFAKGLARNLEQYAPGKCFVIGTDKPRHFSDNKNVEVFKLKQSGLMFPYHDKRFVFQEALKSFNIAVFIDADCRIKGSIEIGEKMPPGVYSAFIEPLSEHINQNRPQDYNLMVKAANKMGVNIKKAFFIGESIMAVSTGDGQEREYFSNWDLLARYLELHKMVSGSGNVMGLAALKAGWTPQIGSMKELCRQIKHLDASHSRRNFIERQRLRIGYHYRLNKARLKALKDFDFYYK